MTTLEKSVLGSIARMGFGTAGEIAASLGIPPLQVAMTISNLSRSGYLRRLNDRRPSSIKLTNATSATSLEMKNKRQDETMPDIREVMSADTASQREVLDDPLELTLQGKLELR